MGDTAQQDHTAIPMARETTYWTQAKALFRKNGKQQLRAWKVNLGLLSCAIIFPLLMLVAQIAINNAISSNGNGECGCKCTSCCSTSNSTDCFDPATRGLFLCPDDYTCQTTNTSVCGIEYSNSRQAAFCANLNPSIWPPLFQVPRVQYRAEPWTPAVAMLYTGADLATADAIAAGMFTTPSGPPNATQAAAAFAQFGASLSQGVFAGNVFSQLGFNLSTTRNQGSSGYVDPAFTAGRNISNLVRNCSGDTLTPLLSAASRQLAASLGDNTTSSVAGFNGTFNCTDVVLLRNDSTAAVNQQLYCGFGADAGCGYSTPQQYAQAWDFQTSSSSAYNISMYYNNSDLPYENQQPFRLQRVNAGLNMAVNGWLRWALGSVASAPMYGLQAFPKVQTEYFVDFATLLGPIFYTWLLALLQPVIVYSAVYEKANRLRVMMAVHGLSDRAYWSIQYVYWFALYCVFMLILAVFGVILRLSFFTKTQASLQVVLYLVWGLNMVAFSFLWSTFFKNPKTATTTAFIYVFAVGLLSAQLLNNYIADNESWLYALQLIPEVALYRALFEIAERAAQASTYGTDYFAPTWSNMELSGLGAALISLAAEIPIFVILTLYCDKVIPSTAGVHRHWLFCLPGSERRRRARLAREANAAVKLLDTEPSAKGINEQATEMLAMGAAEVAAERSRVLEQVDEQGEGQAIVVRNLTKVFPRSRRHAQAKVACKDVCLAIAPGECFGLLGPNGAGKTTLLNMLTGFLEPTSGHALVDGLDVRTNIDDIYHYIGVCPQQDILWDNLTGREHLLFYGRLKNLRGAALNEAVQSTLDAVSLGAPEVANRVAGKYSGGMKRRLSVAISLIGSPPVMYLDEVSTGLDPASRRTLWAAISAAKSKAGMILTTHSMEEAAVLCDRLGIFVDGKLVVLGNPKYLGQRFGGYYVFTITTPPHEEQAASQLVRSMCPGARQTYALNGTQKYELPTSEVTLAKVFDTMQRAHDINVVDWGVANATLEEVFIKFAKARGNAALT